MSTLTEIKELLQKQALSSKRVLDLEEASEYFKIPKQTLYNWTSQKLIPHSKKAGLRFDREEIEKWLLSNPVSTVADLEKKADLYIQKNKRK